ncbi:MAG: phosphomannomutase/phosphoglucomutase [Candidatus Chromulinivorax sp.]
MQKELFRQYDIRGRIGTELSVHDFYQIMHAIIYFFKQQGCKGIIVGMDGRTHGPAIFHQISTACRQAGIDIYFLGVCTTPIASFAQYQIEQAQGCLMITASHNPSEYNGLKIYYNRMAVEGEKLQQIYELYAKKVLVQADVEGKIIYASYLVDQYVDALVSEFEVLKKFVDPVYIDCGNGTAGPVLIGLIEKMGWKNIKLLCDVVDGTYPNHIADPTDSENIQDLCAVLQQNTHAFGVGLDGDADRMAIVTYNKGLISADQLLALFGQDMHATTIIADIKSSTVIQQMTNAQVILAKTGCAYIKAAMQEHQALLGGELSGHFFFRDRHEGYDDGIYAMLRFFELIFHKKISCHDLMASLPTSFVTKDIRIPCADNQKFVIVAAIKHHLEQNSRFVLDCIDGVRFTAQDSWGLIRASNTQPALSVCAQSNSFEGLQLMKKLLIELLQPYVQAEIVEKYIK